jgi:hypothetical protein
MKRLLEVPCSKSVLSRSFEVHSFVIFVDVSQISPFPTRSRGTGIKDEDFRYGLVCGQVP